jgi:hypothetical protein
LEKKSLGESLVVAFDSLIKDHRRNSVKHGEIGIENDALVPDGDNQWSDTGESCWFRHSRNLEFLISNFEFFSMVMVAPGEQEHEQE